MQRVIAILALLRVELIAGRRRVAYLALTLIVTTAAWLVLAALAAPFVGGSGQVGSGINIRNGSQTNAPLPLSYASRIEAVHGAHDVAWLTLQMVGCGSGGQVTLNAWGGPGASEQLARKKAGATLLKKWEADPMGAVITQTTAAKCGWRTGQGITPPHVMASGSIEMHITGVIPGSGLIAFPHFDYINRTGSFLGKNMVMMYLASARDPRHANLLAARIEAAFASDFPSVTATTNATAQNAWARYGKVQQLLAFVMAAILLCATSVLVSVSAHAVAQRRAKFAVLQVLGFQRGTLFTAFALELVVSVILGALLGIGVAMLIGHALATTLIGMISQGARAPHWAYWGLPIWLAVLAAISLAWPAGTIARLRPADYRAM